MSALEMLTGALLGVALGTLPALADKPAGGVTEAREALKRARNLPEFDFRKRREELKKTLRKPMLVTAGIVNTLILGFSAAITVLGLQRVLGFWLPPGTEELDSLTRAILGLLTLLLLLLLIQKLYLPVAQGACALRWRRD